MAHLPKTPSQDGTTGLHTNGLSPTALFNFQAKGDLSPLLVQGRGRVEDFHAGLRCHAKKKKEGMFHWPLTTSRPFFPLDLWLMQSRRNMTSVRWSTKELLRPDGALLPLTSRIKFSPPLVLEANFYHGIQFPDITLGSKFPLFNISQPVLRHQVQWMATKTGFGGQRH